MSSRSRRKPASVFIGAFFSRQWPRPSCRHSRESGNPWVGRSYGEGLASNLDPAWTPAFARVTKDDGGDGKGRGEPFRGTIHPPRFAPHSPPPPPTAECNRHDRLSSRIRDPGRTLGRRRPAGGAQVLPYLAILTQLTGVTEPWIERSFVGTYGLRNARFLDQWIANIHRLPTDAKRDVAAWLAVFCSMRRIKYYAARLGRDGAVAGSHQLRAADLAHDILSSAKKDLPQLVFDNGQINQAYNEDGLALLERIQADVAFIDPPYACRGGDYERDLAFYDDLLRICLGRAKEIENIWDSTCELPAHTNFANRPSAVTGLGQLLFRAKHVPTLIVSYNTSSKISICEIQNLAKASGRKLTAERKFLHPLPTNTKRATTETCEVLLRFDPI